MTWALVIIGWLLLGILVAAALARIMRGRSQFNPEPTRDATAPPAAGQAREDLRISVLVADDDHLLRAVLLGLLERDGRFRQVHSAADGHQALTLAGRENPDVLLLDVQMPIMTGLDLLPLLRQLRPAPAVMLYTADPAAPALRTAAQYHPNYLAKSTPLDVVVDEVAALGTARRRAHNVDPPPEMHPDHKL